MRLHGIQIAQINSFVERESCNISQGAADDGLWKHSGVHPLVLGAYSEKPLGLQFGYVQHGPWVKLMSLKQTLNLNL